MSWFSFILILFALSWAGVGMFRAHAIDKGMLDTPSERSSHFAVTARGGGFIFFVGWFLLLLILNYFKIVTTQTIWFFSPAILVGTIGYLDDRKSLSSSTRLIFQAIGALISLFILGEGGTLLQTALPFFVPLPVCFILTMLCIIWMINLYNFMDGADGVAATQAMFVFGVGGYILFQSHAYELATLAWGLEALLAGFLIWNWPTARIFMGDSGSYFLGCLVALYALISYKFFGISLGIWIILTTPFWFDATVTLVRRIIAKQKWHQPHRSHAYQRLLQGGWSHQKLLIGMIAINIIFSMLALLAFKEPRLVPFSMGLACVLVTCLYLAIEIRYPMFKHWY